ncbi:MAG: sulfur carrier protein ThiS [Gammaproteobacteria bacterium]
MAMEIVLNGEPRQVADGISAAQLLDELALAGQRIALEVNRAIVPRSTFGACHLQPGDQVEIVRAIGGG